MVFKMEEQFNAVPGEIDEALGKLKRILSQLDSTLSENVKLKMFGDSEAKTKLKENIQKALDESSNAFNFLKNKEFELKNYIATIKALHHSFEDKKKELFNVESEISKKNVTLNRLTGSIEEKKFEIETQLKEKEAELAGVKSELESINSELDSKQNEYLTVTANIENSKSSFDSFHDDLAAKQKKLLDLDSLISEKQMKEGNEKVVAESLENKIFELKIQLNKTEEELNQNKSDLLNRSHHVTWIQNELRG